MRSAIENSNYFCRKFLKLSMMFSARSLLFVYALQGVSATRFESLDASIRDELDRIETMARQLSRVSFDAYESDKQASAADRRQKAMRAAVDGGLDETISTVAMQRGINAMGAFIATAPNGLLHGLGDVFTDSFVKMYMQETEKVLVPAEFFQIDRDAPFTTTTTRAPRRYTEEILIAASEAAERAAESARAVSAEVVEAYDTRPDLSIPTKVRRSRAADVAVAAGLDRDAVEQAVRGGESAMGVLIATSTRGLTNINEVFAERFVQVYMQQINDQTLALLSE